MHIAKGGSGLEAPKCYRCTQMNQCFRTDVLVELHVPDFGPVLEFYSLLGFEEAYREENYLVLRRGDSVLNFYGGSEEVYAHSYFSRFDERTKKGFGVEIVIFEPEVTRLYERVKSTLKVVTPLKLRPGGRKDLRVEDPFGDYIRAS